MPGTGQPSPHSFLDSAKMEIYGRHYSTHPLIGGIGAVGIAVAHPPLGDAGAVGAGVLRHGVAGHHRALLLVGAVAAVVVVIAHPPLLDAPAIAAGELIGATGLV